MYLCACVHVCVCVCVFSVPNCLCVSRQLVNAQEDLYPCMGVWIFTHACVCVCVCVCVFSVNLSLRFLAACQCKSGFLTHANFANVNTRAHASTFTSHFEILPWPM
jgi:hypothetical protein